MTKQSIETTFEGQPVFITYSIKNKFLKRYEIESVQRIKPNDKLCHLNRKYLLSLHKVEQERIIKEIKIIKQIP